MIATISAEQIGTNAQFFRAKARRNSKNATPNTNDTELQPGAQRQKARRGGLRDIQTTLGSATAWATNDLRELVARFSMRRSTKHPRLLAAPSSAVGFARIFLAKSAPKETALLFDHQRTIAQMMGYEDNDSKTGCVERFVCRKMYSEV